MDKQISSHSNNNASICPFLGFADDQETSISYPSHQNNCHHIKPIEPINLKHQHQYCLNKNYVTCVIFRDDKFQKVPKELKIQNDSRKKRKKIFITIFLVLFIGLIFGLFSLFKQQRKIDKPLLSIFRSTATIATIPTKIEIPVTTGENPTSTITSAIQKEDGREFNKEEGFVITETTTMMPTHTSEVTITPTSTVIYSHFLETPFGNNPQLMLHVAREGENFIFLADQFKTSVEAIKSVNTNFSDVLIIGKVLIIPIDTVDVTGVPSFTPYQVEDDHTTLAKVAEKFTVNLSELTRYNNIPTSFDLRKGDWLIIPIEKIQ